MPRGSLPRSESVTHAIQAPGVFQLISAPGSSEPRGLLFAEVCSKLLRNGFCRQEGAIEVESYDYLLLAGGHCQRCFVNLEKPW